MEEKSNVLIVEDDPVTAKNLKRHLKRKGRFDVVEHLESVAEACEYVQVQNTDVVVLDLIMPVQDGYFFMEEMDRLRLSKRPHIIVTSALAHEHAVKKAFGMGAKYYLIKPYENEIMYRRITDVLEIGQLPAPDLPAEEKSADQKIMEMFLMLGVPPHLKGYQYLREAVKMVSEDPSMIYGITKRLYPAVAERFDVTPTKVELAIRHTLEVLWQRNKMENLNRVFGCEVYLKKSKPTNGEFIALVSDKLFTDRVSK